MPPTSVEEIRRAQSADRWIPPFRGALAGILGVLTKRPAHEKSPPTVKADGQDLSDPTEAVQ
jgi:hypothetical protein